MEPEPESVTTSFRFSQSTWLVGGGGTLYCLPLTIHFFWSNTSNINYLYQDVYVIHFCKKSSVQAYVGLENIREFFRETSFQNIYIFLHAAVISPLIIFSHIGQFSMEDSIEVILQDHGRFLSTKRPHPVVSAGLGALLTGLYGVWSVFTMPGFRKIPWNLKVLEISFFCF